MTDMTAMTAQVREYYQCGAWDYDQTFKHHAANDFDTWLASVKAEAWEEGRDSVRARTPSAQPTHIELIHTTNPYKETP